MANFSALGEVSYLGNWDKLVPHRAILAGSEPLGFYILLVSHTCSEGGGWKARLWGCLSRATDNTEILGYKKVSSLTGLVRPSGSSVFPRD
jgi:hypothetical protein